MLLSYPNFHLLGSNYMLGSVLASWNQTMNEIESLCWRSHALCFTEGERREWPHWTAIQPNAVLYRHGQVVDPDSGGLQRFLNTGLELVADTHMSGIFFRQNEKQRAF